jgi:superfamily I DNA/RNA helicase
MGWVSCLEDIVDTYNERASFFDSWSTYLGPRPQRRHIEEARDVLGDPMERPRRIIRDFWRFYKQNRPLAQAPAGYWERHYANIDALHTILAGVAGVRESTPGAWEILGKAEARLREFFRTAGVYGPLSRTVLKQVEEASGVIRHRCTQVESELKRFDEQVRKLPPGEGQSEISQALRQLEEIRSPLDADLARGREYDERTRRVKEWGDHFVRLYAHFAVQSRYRPALQHLHRLRLNEQQESFVALNHGAAYRIQGASGSGKTIILIHRALRLALESPAAIVRLFTINRSLAVLLRESVAAINGSVPKNLHVAAFYDFLQDALGLFKKPDQYRLVDDRSGERIAVSWRDFYHHKGTTTAANVFADEEVRTLVGSIAAREKLQVDACRYLRDEMIYVQGAYRSHNHERRKYLYDPRVGRSIPLLERQRRACLKVLHAWEEWLQVGRLCDVDGLTLRVANHIVNQERLDRVCEAFPTHHVLVDEVQDFSTLELDIIRRLVLDPDGQNRFFFVGDLNQKVFPKQHHTRRAGFDFTGRARNLTRNYRNTKQILRAAYCLPEHFPPQADEPLEVAAPELSQYEGGLPVCLGCTRESHVRRVLEVVRKRRGNRVAVVSENDTLLGEVRREAARLGLRCYELFRVEDLDRWRKQEGDALAADLVVSRLEAVKGFEFDTVIACDLSEGVVPRPGTPPEEYWREAAVVYAALTRARDELVMTYVGEPSIFVKAMGGHVAMHDGVTEGMLSQVLAGA